MKTFLKKILPRHLIDRYVEYRIYKNRYFDSQEDLTYVCRKKQGLINHADAIETIAIRGSSAAYGFIPRYIDNSYNLGLTSTDAYFNYHLYLKSKEMLPRLKNVVFYMSGFVCGLSLIRTREKYRAVSYKYFFDIPYEEDGLIDEKIEEKIFNKCKKIKVHLPDNYWGYTTKKFFATGTDAESRAKIILRENRREPDQMIWIQKLIEQIIEDKKNIFIVIPSHPKKLKKNLPPKEELYKKTYALLNNYKDLPNVQLIDLYDSALFVNSDMGDNDHFNKKGAKKCTKIVKEYIEKQCRQ